jgi:hypothetical protein
MSFGLLFRDRASQARWEECKQRYDRRRAQAGDAQRAETAKTDSVADEHAVAKPCAHKGEG